MSCILACGSGSAPFHDCKPRGYQEPEREGNLDRNCDEVVVPPAVHSPLAEEIAGAAGSLMVHLGGEANPILRMGTS